jgi:signal transduction histidine kinase
VIASSLETWRTMFAKEEPQVRLQIEDMETSTGNGAFGLVADNLIRNAFQHGDKDGIEVSFKDAILTIRNTIAPGERDAKGIGILMCERICARNGWQLSLDATDDIFTAKVMIKDA